MTYKLTVIERNQHSLSISFQFHLSNPVEALQVALQVEFLLHYEKRVMNVISSSLT
jgi:hypothetical protein